MFCLILDVYVKKLIKHIRDYYSKNYYFFLFHFKMKKKIIIGIIIIIFLIIIFPILYSSYQDSTNKLFRDVDVSSLNSNTIPPVLYKTGPFEYEELSLEIRNNFDNIVKDNPDYKIEYYSDNQSRNFIKDNFDYEVLEAYDKLKPGAYKADLFRYCILYKKGGVYGDLTQKYLVKLDELVNRQKDKLVLSRDLYRFKTQSFDIDIAFMASVKNLDVFDQCIKQIVKNVKNKYYGISSLAVTGPGLMSKIFSKNIQAQKLYKMTINKDKKYTVKNNKKVIKRKNFNHKTVILEKYHYNKLWHEKNIYN